MSAITDSSVLSKESFVQKYPLFSFFMLAIGLTWIFMIIDALGSHGILPFRLPLPLMVVMGYMPTLAAVLVAFWTKGREGVKNLLKKLFIARVGVGWYLFAIFGMIGVYVLAILIQNVFGSGPDLPFISESAPNVPLWQLALMSIPMFIVIGLVNGEELAWRGFAIPRLQAKYSALTSSIIMGLLWSLFHLPLFFTKTGSSQADMSFLSFTVSTVSITVLYTWLLNNTRGSVLLAYLFHAAQNTWSRIIAVDHAATSINWTVALILLVLAVIVVLTNGAENLSHKYTRITE